MKSILSFPRKITGFIGDVYREIKLVEFPSRSETFKMTNTVFLTSIVLGIILFALDSVFVFVRNYLTSLT